MTDAEGARLERAYAERVAMQDQAHPGYRNAWSRFATFLLAYGGQHVVPPLVPDPLLAPFTKWGQRWEGPVLHRPMQRSQCHNNAIALWREGHAAAIGTGYALADDGLWREHSWAVSHAGELVETTVVMEIYFGVELRGSDAESFAAGANIPFE